MKKYLNLALIYAAAAMAGGVFYREFTKWKGFTGSTALGKVHTHLFVLGMFMFMVVALFARDKDPAEIKAFRLFMRIYNTGLPLTALMLVARGVPQVTGMTLSSGLDASISGIAGIGHILVGAGIVLLIAALKKSEDGKAREEKG